MDILLFNPYAGTAKKSGLTADLIIEKLNDRGVKVAPSHLESEEEARRVAVKAPGRVIVAGGDGTIHKLLKTADECHTLELAIIPVGTANHLAGALGIPDDIDAAIDVIARGHIKHIDLGKVDGHVFSQAAGVGLHARMFHLYGERRDKSRIDAATAAVTTFSDWNPQLMRVIIDGEAYVEEVTQVTAANTSTYGGTFTIAPDAKVDDGLLDVVILGRLSKLEIIEYGLAAVTGDIVNLPKAYTARARKIEISHILEEPVEVHADAEPVGHTPVVIEVLPGCLDVVVP